MNLPRELKQFKGEIRFKEPLSKHTSFKIGGRVKIWARPQDLDSLILLIRFAKLAKLPVLIIGAGSNLLVADRPLEAVAVNLCSANFSKVEKNSSFFIAGAGIRLSRLIAQCLKFNRGGLEFLVGIPGTLGGAIWNNAGIVSKGGSSSMADIIEEVRVILGNGKIRRIKRKNIFFGYRESSLKQCIILEAKLRLKARPSHKIRELLRKNLLLRKKNQDLNARSAGCIFKNPQVKIKGLSRPCSAGFLIEASGLKGRRIGRARVCERHANFIINTGKAKAADVIRLIDLIKRDVKRKFEITLEPEIQIIGDKRKASSSRNFSKNFRFL